MCCSAQTFRLKKILKLLQEGSHSQVHVEGDGAWARITTRQKTTRTLYLSFGDGPPQAQLILVQDDERFGETVCDLHVVAALCSK